jgi:hypothetical protein
VARLYSNEQQQVYSVIVGDHPGFDISSLAGDVRIELKTESSTSRTKNISVEFKCTETGAPSGIDATKANIWLHLALTPDGWIAIEYTDIPKLREVARKYGVVKRCARNALCWIVPLNDFCQHAKRVFPFQTQFHDQLIQSAGGPKWQR